MMHHTARGPHTILVIEDDYATLEYLHMLLHLHGYAVQIARNGSQGVSAATTRAFDGILTDLRLPDINGLEMSRLLRDNHGITTPIIMMTADHDRALEMALQSMGVSLLLKPFEPDVLVKQVAAMVTQGNG